MPSFFLPVVARPLFTCDAAGVDASRPLPHQFYSRFAVAHHRLPITVGYSQMPFLERIQSDQLSCWLACTNGGSINEPVRLEVMRLASVLICMR